MIAAFDPAPARPLWLITLADLSLLLVGFFVLLQANRDLDGERLAQGLRAGFGIEAPVRADAPMPVAIAAVDGFASGSATLPPSRDIVDWARDATRDARVTLRLTGYTDTTATDVDAATGSATLLAADRARALAAALAAADVARDRFTIETAAAPGRRQVVVTLGFTGDGAVPEQQRTSK